MKKTAKVSAYIQRGVSSTKEDVQKATKKQEAGIFVGAFCKVVEDLIDPKNYCALMHADGAGTKSSLAYMYYKETGDVSVFRGIAQDSIVMNTDDLICVGAVNDFIFSNTIGRNAHRIDKKVLTEIIAGYEDFKNKLKKLGIKMVMAGGETADLGDLVQTVIVDSTIFVRLKKKDVIDCSKIRPGDVIVGLASFGKSSYENHFNSGISSNGFTAARHALLSKIYAKKYPETFSSTIERKLVHSGPYKLTDKLPGSKQTIGKAMLSPTRTYIPVVKEILIGFGNQIHGLINNTGGGQVKCKNFGESLHYIKDDLFEPPPIFMAIQNQGQISQKEMYQIFNMGQRLEVYCKPHIAENVIKIARKFKIDAKIIGRVENNKVKRNKVTIKVDNRVFSY